MKTKKNDFDWLAFQYLANELSDADRDAFEELLGESQDAREALARSVELTQAVADLEPIEVELATASAKQNLWRTATWISAAIASLLAIVVVYQQFVMDTDPVAEESADQVSDEAEQLALNWVQTFDTFATQRNDEAEQELLEDEFADESMDLFAEPSDDDAPDWMFAAVEGLAADDMDEDMDMEMMEESDNDS